MAYRFGFIGCGDIAREHAKVVMHLGHAVCAVSAKNRSERLDGFAKDFGAKSFVDWKILVANEKPDALIVALPWNVTHKIICDILATGIPVLVEKPVVLDSESLEAFYRDNKSILPGVMVGYNRRFYDFIPGLKAELSSRKDLLSVSVSLPESVVGLEKKFGPEIREHILTYMSSHWFDLLFYLLGELDIVWKHESVDSNGKVLGYHAVLSTRGSDVPVMLAMNFDSPANTQMTFSFPGEVIELKPMEVLTHYKGMSVIDPTVEMPLRRYLPTPISVKTVSTNFKPGFEAQMIQFIRQCVEQKALGGVHGCTVSEALRVTKFCESLKAHK
jgi:predicted dehydrogenase